MYRESPQSKGQVPELTSELAEIGGHLGLRSLSII